MKFPLATLTVFLVGCSLPSEGTKWITLTDGESEVMVNAEIADEPAEYAQGLMERGSLPEGRGMLFVFNDEVPRSFWMKNTLIPLDIMFFDEKGGFVSSTSMVPCEENPCPLYSSGAPAMYALEVPGGFVQQNQIGKGWQLKR
jgi:uncharacterized membrane protein (UPF0127 family)